LTLRGHENFAKRFNICSPKLGGRLHLPPHLVAPVTDGYMVLVFLEQLQNRRKPTLATKRQIWHG